ncbi:MAG: CDP-diacylglycerol--serine O-phosphatidyltransferase [Bacteroidia bacterium]|nr:CDP-diacylglycerol--serine O-phosphatidyltransferase [Bacteroidia bacterium]
MKKHIPNAITSLNLVCGALSILASFQGKPEWAAFLIIGAAVLDFFDGFAARLLKVHGELGKQLDSLADVISFGLAPGFIWFHLHQPCINNDFSCYFSYTFLLIPVFSAIRLAKFNIDTRQTDKFIGLPTPANAIFISAIPLAQFAGQTQWFNLLTTPTFLIIFPILSAYLLVAELPLLALKFKNFQWHDNRYRYVLIISCIISVLFFKFVGISISIVLYIIISIITNLLTKNNEIRSTH